ncbi:hypothetical protein AgCh_000602 [Apium graveolens]
MMGRRFVQEFTGRTGKRLIIFHASRTSNKVKVVSGYGCESSVKTIQKTIKKTKLSEVDKKELMFNGSTSGAKGYPKGCEAFST